MVSITHSLTIGESCTYLATLLTALPSSYKILLLHSKLQWTVLIIKLLSALWKTCLYFVEQNSSPTKYSAAQHSVLKTLPSTSFWEAALWFFSVLEHKSASGFSSCAPLHCLCSFLEGQWKGRAQPPNGFKCYAYASDAQIYVYSTRYSQTTKLISMTTWHLHWGALYTTYTMF